MFPVPRALSALAIAAAVVLTPAGAAPAHAETTATCPAAKVLHPTTRWQGTYCGALTESAGSDANGSWPARDYYSYVPPAAVLKPPGSRSLVVYLHGTTQTATNAALAAKLNDLADEEGFVVVYPEESPTTDTSTDSGNGGRFWAWGRAAYEPRGTGEIETIARITRRAMTDYAIDPARVYVGGLSAGGIMTSVMAATYPDLYRGAAIWAGCAYLCADANGDLGYQRMGEHARAVPAILFAVTADHLVNPAMSAAEITGWTGLNDLADDGEHNGSVAREATEGPTTYGATAEDLTPAPNTGPDDGSRGNAGTCLYAYPNPHSNHPCPGGPLGWDGYPFTVTKFADNTAACAPATRPTPLPQGCVAVESWVIHGMLHNYAGGTNEGTFADPLGPDTTTAAWRFLDAHAPALAPPADIPELPLVPLTLVAGTAVLLPLLRRQQKGARA